MLSAVVLLQGCARARPSTARSNAPLPLESARVEPSESRFERISDEDCRDAVHVEDLDSRTLVISPSDARFVEPGQAWASGTDASAGLPSEHGSGALFTRTPLVLQLNWHRMSGMEQIASGDYGHFLRSGERWVQIRQSFAEIPIALPVVSGTVVVGWTQESEQHRGDLDSVPVGNMTRAWLIASDGTVSPLAQWPEAMTWQQQSTPHTLWAIADVPKRSGQFLLRVPLDGKASFYAIPGVARCTGIDRLTQLVDLGHVTDDSAELTVWDTTDCVAKKQAGQYHFHAGQFARTGDAEPIGDTAPSDRTASARGAAFSFEGDTVLVTRGATIERDPLPVSAPAAEQNQRVFQVSAGGREVWVFSAIRERCLLYRYLWPTE